MRKFFILIIVILLIIPIQSGCKIKSKTDISVRESVTVLGIDEQDGNIILTIVLTLIQPTDNNSSESSVSIYTAEGNSIYEAIQKFHPYTDQVIFWGHVNYVIIGEETARLGINKYMDLFARDHEIKQNLKILIAQGMSAGELIKVTNTQQPLNDTLMSLFSDAKNLTSENQVSTLQYMQMISSKQSSLYIPAIKTADKKEKSEEEQGKKLVMLDGYAIFKEDILEDFLEGADAKGMNWIVNKNHAGYLTLKDENNETVVTEVTGNTIEYEINYEGQTPKIVMKIKLNSNIVEYHGKENIFEDGKIDKLVKQQNEIVANEVMNVVTYLQDKKIDVLGINDKIHHRYPVKTKDYDDIWPDIFAEAEISAEVKSSIDRTYNINQPVEYDESEDK